MSDIKFVSYGEHERAIERAHEFWQQVSSEYDKWTLRMMISYFQDRLIELELGDNKVKPDTFNL